VAVSVSVSVDPARCRGHGVCALLLLDRVDLDDWGFPLVDATPLSGWWRVHRARRAARACPVGALFVEPHATDSGTTGTDGGGPPAGDPAAGDPGRRRRS